MPKGVKYGGRVAGTSNKSKQAILDKAKALGITPLDYMLQVLNDKTRDDADRMEAAKNAAPFVHRKQPQAIENTEMNKIQELSEDELLQRLKELEK